MPIRKVGDPPERKSAGWALHDRLPCQHPEHDPPGHLVLAPGIYEYECPGCGEKRIIRIEGAFWGSPRDAGYGSPTRYAVLHPRRIVNE